MLTIDKGREISVLISNLASARDLRAGILSLAQALNANDKQAFLQLRDPRIAPAAIQREWAQSLAVLSPGIVGRMHLLPVESHGETSSPMSKYDVPENLVPIERPNYRFEVLRWLITAAAHQGTQSVKSLEQLTHVSRTPIAAALNALEKARLISRVGRGRYSVRPEDISQDALARLQALPQTVRFRFGLGSAPKSPGRLLPQVNRLMHASRGAVWSKDIYLSGVAGAYASQHRMDLMGIPRVDLAVHVGSQKTAFSTTFMREVDDGLEADRSPLGHAPVVVTLVHSEHVTEETSAAKLASPGDIFLSMLDLGLKGPAMEYIKGYRA